MDNVVASNASAAARLTPLLPRVVAFNYQRLTG